MKILRTQRKGYIFKKMYFMPVLKAFASPEAPVVIALLFSFAYDNPVYPYNKLLYRYDIIRCFKSCARSIHLTDLRPFPMMYVFVP